MKNLFTIKLRSLPVLLLFCLFTVVAVNAQDQKICSADKSSDKTKLRDLPPFIYGVTLENASDGTKRKEMIKFIKRLCVKGQKPFVRIVFQNSETAEDYDQAVKELHEVAFLVGEFLDSQSVKNFTVSEYQQRAESFWGKYQNLIDVWEIGNEINGDWVLSADTTKTIDEKNREVREKIERAFRVIKPNGGRTALTLYYNDDNRVASHRKCWNNKENEMFYWAQNYISDEMKRGLDYVLVSYYDDPSSLEGCRDDDTEKQLIPDWQKDFARLNERLLFPNIKLGFGEVGTRQSKRKVEEIQKYYGGKVKKQINNPKFTGGYFWWYFEDDMSSARKEELIEVMRASIEKSMKP